MLPATGFRCRAEPVRICRHRDRATNWEPRSAPASPQPAARNTGRNAAIGVLAAAAIGVAAFFLWPRDQAPAQTPAPLVVDSAIPQNLPQDPAPAQPVAETPTP